MAVQIRLTEKNERWIISAAKKWSTTPTVMTNELAAEAISHRKHQDKLAQQRKLINRDKYRIIPP